MTAGKKNYWKKSSILSASPHLVKPAGILSFSSEGRRFAPVEKTGSIGFCKLGLEVELKIGGGQVPLGSRKS